LPNENDDESEEQKPEVHPDKSDQSALEVLAKAAKIAGQVTAIAGAFAAVLSLIGGIWIAAAAYIIPGGGEALSSASLTGLISLVALGGVWFLFIAVGTLGFSGYCYGTMFKGFDSVRHKETLLARRFLPELVLFAGNTIAVVIVYFVNTWNAGCNGALRDARERLAPAQSEPSKRSPVAIKSTSWNIGHPQGLRPLTGP
jgi:hypothetical protein